MSCDLVSGRLLNECQLGRSGIKTLYFTKFNDFDSLTGVVESGGEITDLGTDPITIYQFDMQANVGNFEEIPASTPENGTIFLTQNVTLTLFFVKPADLANLNNLKRGRWTIWALDFQGKIRLFGRTRGMIASGGSDVSGVAPGDKKGLDLILTAFEQDYAVFMDDYTDEPFDNFTNVTVISDEIYGPELHTFANAASDPNGNEADAITGWSENGLNGTGANVFESQSGVVNVGTYSFHADCTDTPTISAGIYIDLQAAPFNFVNGEEGKVSLDVRHVGAGGGWRAALGASPAGLDGWFVTIGVSETTFQELEHEWTHDADHRYLLFTEGSSGNDGGLYVDNISVKKKI